MEAASRSLIGIIVDDSQRVIQSNRCLEVSVNLIGLFVD